MKKLRTILSSRWGTFIFWVILLLLKWYYVVNGFSISKGSYILVAWRAFEILLLCALIHILIIIIIALLAGKPEKEWWEQEKPANIKKYYSLLVQFIDVTAPILIYGGLVWIVVTLELKTLLFLTIGFALRLCIDQIFRLVNRRRKADE